MSYKKTATVLIFIAALIMPITQAIPSGNKIPPLFYYKSGEWYDDWDVTRNNSEGRDGYLPQLILETIGENNELAFQIGERFQNTYSDKVMMSVAILKYVQRWVEYGYDSDNVFMRGVSQDEWAWNADELAHSFDETKGLVAIGDCEDMAFLCATIYQGAGIETAIIDAPGHVALLIWLPDYPNANRYWDLENDDRESGWIWVEATGSTNSLGWTPPDYTEGGWTAYTQNDLGYPQQPIQTDNDNDEFTDWDTIILIVFVLFILFSRSRR